MVDVHDDITEPTELGASQWLGEEVSNHFISWAVLDGNVLAFDDVGNKEVSNVHVPRAFAA